MENKTNDNFKEVFTRIATTYAEYVENKIKEQSQSVMDEAIHIDHMHSAYVLMNEVRTVNVMAVTLTRMNSKENSEAVMYSAN